jgi:hypothetical protein
MVRVRELGRRKMAAVAAGFVAIALGTGCATDGKTLRAPVFPPPDPPVVTVPPADRDESGILPFDTEAGDPIITDAAVSTPLVPTG